MAAARERKYAGLDSTASHPRASCLRRGTSSRSLEFAPTHPRRVQYERPVATACHPWMSCFYILTLLRFLPIPAAQRHEGPDANALHRLFLTCAVCPAFLPFFYIPFRCRFFAIPLFACCSLQSAVVYAPFDSPRSCSNTLPPLTQLLCFPTVYHLPPFPPYSGYLRHFQAMRGQVASHHATKTPHPLRPFFVIYMHPCMFVLPALFQSPQSPGSPWAWGCLRRPQPISDERQYEGPVATASHLWASCFRTGHILALLGFQPHHLNNPNYYYY